MKKMGKVARLAALLVLTLLFGLFPIELRNNLNKVQAATTLNNPRTVADSSMKAKQKVTWDCVWFGAYPQSEVTSGDIYNTLKNATGWDENNDIVIDGNKYRRLKGEDATYHNTSSSMFDYNWNNDYSSYHYFKYEPVKWRVLGKDDNQILLLADQVLDNQKYNQNQVVFMTWEESSIRSWLNGNSAWYNQSRIDYTKQNFINDAFLEEEQKAIPKTSVITNGVSGEKKTLDKIFLLSESEVYTEMAKKYGFVSESTIYDEARMCKCSTYSWAMGINKVDTNVAWWLRSTSSYSYSPYIAHAVENNGSVVGGGSGYNVNYDAGLGIRPALHLNLSSANLYSYAGTVCSDGIINEEPAPTRVYQDTTSSGNTGNNSGSNNNTGNNNSNNANNTGNNNSNNANNTGNNSNNINNNKNNTTANTKPSNKTTASKKPTKRALLPVEKMTGSLKSVKSPAKSTLAIIWKKLRKVTGYQVQFCAKSNFKKGTIERKFKQKVTKTKVRPVKSKKKYYVRMRPYTKSGSKTYYGKWSKVKSVKIK